LFSIRLFRLFGIILVFIVIILILACSNAITTTQTPKFALIPHEAGEAPMIPHPRLAFTECDLCHIEASAVGSFIKIDEGHSCDECHESLIYQGPCEETSPVNTICAMDICHLYPTN
jgi:hypothetical protein